jgi:hypothetical protein
VSHDGWTARGLGRYASPVDRRDKRRALLLASLKADALVSEAWEAHIRDETARGWREQQARREEANREELLGILAQMRRRGWKTR